MNKRESFLHSIGASIVWKTFERISGLAKHVVVAAVIGLSSQLDTFYMAIAILGLLVFSWGNLIDVIAVPQLVGLKQKNDINAFKKTSCGLFYLCILFSLVVIILTFFFKEFIAKIAIGFEPERQYLISKALIWFFPVILLYIPMRFFGSLFRALRNFSIFYQSEFLMSFVALVIIIFFKNHPAVLLFSYSSGVFVAFFYLFFNGKKYLNWRSNPFSKEIKTVFHIAPSLLLLQGSQYFFILTDRIFITFLEKGSVGALAYGRMLSYILVNMLSFRSSFITVFSETDPDNPKKRTLYNDIISLSIFTAVPTSVFLYVFGRGLIALFLERGVFSSADTEMVYESMTGFAWALLPFLALGPVEQIFQVQERIDLLVWMRVIGIIINAVLNAIFIFGFGWGIWGIAIATSVSRWLIFGFSIRSAHQTGLDLDYKRILTWLLWIFSGAVVIALALSFVGKQFEPSWSIIFIGIAYGVLILVLGVLYNGAEGELVRNTLKRLQIS
jgi:peptidoglycan biosynthesis protein MviN/MurJ (putative lipid II flippase)